jgi:hypothetical protein
MKFGRNRTTEKSGDYLIPGCGVVAVRQGWLGWAPGQCPPEPKGGWDALAHPNDYHGDLLRQAPLTLTCIHTHLVPLAVEAGKDLTWTFGDGALVALSCERGGGSYGC